MICLFYIACVAGSTVWTIRFKDDGQEDEFIITDDLCKFNIDVYNDISETGREHFGLECKNELKKYDMDIHNIVHSDESSCGFPVKKHALNVDRDVILNETTQFCEIYVPITKALFFKVINLTLQNDVKFTANEIYHVLENLFVFLKDKTCILHAIYKNMIDSPSLFDELVDLYNEMNNGHLFQNVLPSLSVELGNHIVLVVTDDTGNVTVVSADQVNDKDCIRMYIGISKMIGLFPGYFFEMDADFILKNDKFLHDLYSESANTNMTVIIHFSALELTKSPLDNIIACKLEELSKSQFLQLECVQTIHLCFVHTIINFNLAFLTNKKINIYCNNCTFSNGVHLPDNCGMISFEDSYIKTKLILSEHIDTIVFRNVDIAEDMTIRNNTRHIELINITGHINMSMKEFHIREYKPKWSFKQIRTNDSTIEVLMIDNIIFEDIHTNQNIDKLVMKNIELNNRTITIRSNVKLLYLENISGRVNIHDSIVHHGLLDILLDDGSVHIQNTVFVQKDSASNTKKYKIFELSNAYVKSNITFHNDLFKISLRNVEFSGEHRLLSLNSTLYEVHIRNCNGRVLFNGIAGLDRIFFTKNSNIINEERFTFTRSYLTGETKLEIENITFNRNITLSSDINNVKLSNVVCSRNNVFSIHSVYDNLVMSNCQGRYCIPGIIHNEQKIIDMHDECNLSIKLVEENKYDVRIKHLSVEGTYTFDFGINGLMLCYIENNNGHGCLQFTRTCRSINLSNVYCFVKFQNVKLFENVALYNVKSDIVDTVLSVPVQHIELEQITISESITFSDLVEYVKIKYINENMELNTNIVSIKSNCKYIYLQYNNTLVNISTILKYADNSAVYTAYSSFCELITTNTESHLVLKYFVMDEDWQLVKKIRSLELESIFSTNTSFVLNILHELENVSIKSCIINISFSHPDKLKKISINKSKVFYDPNVYSQVKCISIANVDIDKTLVFSDTAEDIWIKDVRIRENESIIFSNNVTSLFISNVAGSVNMSRTVVSCFFELKGKETIEIKKTEDDVFSLYMSKICFLTNYEFSKRIKTIKLRDVKADGYIVKISNIHQVEIISCPSEIKLLNSSNEAEPFVQEHSSYVNGLFMLLNIHVLKLQDKIFDHTIELPDCTKITILENIEMCNNVQFVANQQCEEVHLLSCKGVFNLTNITKLKKLVFVSSMNACDLQINNVCLNDLNELEIGGYVNNDHIISVMSLCHSLKRLTLHNPMLSYKEGNCMIHIYHTNKYLQFSVDNNIDLLSKIFNFNMISKLEYLDVSRLFLDYRRIKIWNKFKRLHTIIVNYDSIDQIFSKDIPSNIEVIEYLEYYGLVLNTLNYKKWMINNFDHLRMQRSIKILTIPCILSCKYNILCYLPPFLEKLTITTHCLPTFSETSTVETKVHVKELVLYARSDCFFDILKPKNFAKRYCVECFDYLQNFIDFEKLEKLAIETETAIVYLNTKTYQISNQ